MLVSNFNIGVVIPFVMGIPLIVFGIWGHKEFFRKGFGKFLKIFVGICYAAFAVCFVAFTILVGVSANTEPKQGADAVIVLGAAIHGDQPTLTLKNRLNKAIEYAEENPNAIIIVSGGQGPQESVTEAQVMAEYLRQHGISESRIIQERAATSTYENFVYSKQLLDRIIGDDLSIVFITSDFHIFRAENTARAAGFTDISSMSARSVWYMRPSFYCREMVALGLYYLFGLV